MTTRSGIGFDVHPLVEGRALVLGGVTIPYARGLAGHSDGDGLIHAIIDAMLGAAALGDIGTHFAPGDARYKGIASSELLTATISLLRGKRWRVTFVDATIIAERPILRPHIGDLRHTLAAILHLDVDCVSVKATTTDGLGFVGRGEGIGTLAIATIERIA
ncbi:MAG: 2-C-methyl-D-erythritol 2,4-cyclodiphosphate synthase [Chloroflexi bacterium]|nr:2-C-methyl-D-erythritol 2,4-cyclodiphosphate synthase [Chloroflexota bacterium]